MAVNIINLSIIFHVWTNGLVNNVLRISLPQDKLVTTGAISSAVCLKELTISGWSSPSLVSGAVEGIVRKEGVKKLVVESVLSGELQ